MCLCPRIGASCVIRGAIWRRVERRAEQLSGGLSVFGRCRGRRMPGACPHGFALASFRYRCRRRKGTWGICVGRILSRGGAERIGFLAWGLANAAVRSVVCRCLRGGTLCFLSACTVSSLVRVLLYRDACCTCGGACVLDGRPCARRSRVAAFHQPNVFACGHWVMVSCGVPRAGRFSACFVGRRCEGCPACSDARFAGGFGRCWFCGCALYRAFAAKLKCCAFVGDAVASGVVYALFLLMWTGAHCSGGSFGRVSAVLFWRFATPSCVRRSSFGS